VSVVEGAIEGSRRLGVLRFEQLQRALSRFGYGEFISAEPIPHGLFGQNVFVTSTTGRYVLRGLGHSDWQFHKERYFCEEIRTQTQVPVPHPYRIDESSDIFGWPYVLMPRMPGVFIHEENYIKTLTLEDRASIAAAMGETLAELHRCRFPHCGEYDPLRNVVAPLDQPFSAWIQYHLGRTLENCAKLPDFSPAADLEWLRREIKALAPALDVPFEPSAVMNDFKEGNANHEKVDGRWRVSGLFDLMEFYAGDGEADLSRLGSAYLDLDKKVFRAFLDAYLERRPARPQFKERFKLYMIADRLTIWDYGIRNGWFQAGAKMREWFEKYTGASLR